jgi:hypothetical protein
VLPRLTPYLLLTGLGLLFFGDLVLHPTQALYSDHSDLLAEHLPAKRFLVRSYHETGELPLWCPYQFAGSPFLHDPQVGLFYPPYWLLLALPERYAGAALSWLTVLHVLIAGWGMYAYARTQGLTTLPALVAACGFMFAGKWMLHLLAAGHTITVGLAWLPLLLIGLERAVRRRSLLDATWAGAVFGLVVLGTHPQWTFYAGLFAALWTLGPALEQAGYLGGEGARSWRRTAAALARWAGFGACAGALGLALAAVQLLPTLEAADLSTRAAGVATADVIDGGTRTLLFLVGPALMTKPTSLMWEDRGGLGLVWLIAAALAPLLCRGRVRFQAGVYLALILFSVGGAIAFQALPGFRVFRGPTRMMLVAAFPVAFLAGSATQALFAAEPLAPGLRRRCRKVLIQLVVAVAILTGGFAVRMLLGGQAPRFHVYWLSLLVTLPAAWWLLGRGPAAGRYAPALWGAVLLIDLWALAWPLVEARPEEEVYAASDCVAVAARVVGEGRVLDRDAPPLSAGTPLGGGAPVAVIEGMESLRGYNPLDYLRYKEYLQFLGDRDGELHPMDGPLTFPVIGNFPVVNKPLLDLLGVSCLLQPSDFPLEGAGWRAVAADPRPRGFDFATGGTHALPPYTVYENADAFPRAFVVPTARPLPERAKVLPALKQTDFRREVLLEGWQGTPSPAGGGEYSRRAAVRDRRPNRVVVEVEAGEPGYLVLADPWYPGWRCVADGRPAPLYRANYLFRATPVGPDAAEVVFTFEPDSYRRGRLVSGAALAAVAGVVIVGLGWRALGRKRGA